MKTKNQIAKELYHCTYENCCYRMKLRVDARFELQKEKEQ